MKYYIYYINFDYIDQNSFDNEIEAHKHAKIKGWEYRIVLNPKGKYSL